ncbi:flagellar motor switch protein FliG [Sporolactobacillus laevolacticus]|jgi:flagellar motor switch protein FliG|uniref:Flagellar motor switch protein FliG n=1 Tax=Sporolactobacillus laevolacticus DSM 442 TaxID=1395513 RepID=V6IZV5_9BACL|nr:flagellar motor switch protein FliG [Sporolactobacillus laevolacticus]EST13072.1 flagellar motor switch protein FliG [Sporolactobacillus laevolacticus DSM 442]MDF2910980.1 flagellar motor switch protein FliG [Sporolactobacillus laevolacticus]MDN3954005.1 flagellar motor switch protein FliG [Sporolactobacillus laevolacticus]
MPERKTKLTGKQKAAILMIALGTDVSANIFKQFTEQEIEDMTLEISNARKIDAETKTQVVDEFFQTALAQEYISQGGISYAKQILEKALGSDEANKVIQRLTSTLQVKPFDFMRKSDPQQILNFIQNEHPQTIALVLSYLDPDQAGAVLSALPVELQANVAQRIAQMDRTSPETISQVERILEKKISSSSVNEDYTQTGGITSIVSVLNGVDRTTERNILEKLEKHDPDLAEEIKKRMFVFEDIIVLDDRAIQRVIRESENEDLILAMRTASDEVKDLLFHNMSERMAASFKEEMEYMGPVRLHDVEEAQTRIVNTIRKLEDAGEIVIARGKGDDVIV